MPDLFSTLMKSFGGGGRSLVNPNEAPGGLVPRPGARSPGGYLDHPETGGAPPGQSWDPNERPDWTLNAMNERGKMAMVKVHACIKAGGSPEACMAKYGLGSTSSRGGGGGAGSLRSSSGYRG
jgi:hypothetical protein